jgi:hypothetical protein
MICPHCKILNKCNCENCNPDKLTEGVIIQFDDDLSECFYCHKTFSEGESTDLEFEIMLEEGVKKISPELSLEWAYSDYINRIKIEREVGCGYYIMSVVFQKYFSMHVDNVDESTLFSLKRGLMIKRIIE